MIQRCQDLGFPLEAKHAFGIPQEGFGQDLEGNIALERGIVCAIDLAHAALAERGQDFVMPELFAHRKRHTKDFSPV